MAWRGVVWVGGLVGGGGGRMKRVDGVASLGAEKGTVSAPSLEPVQADGDPVGWLPAEIELEPEPIKMRVPWA